ncbi:MAG: undecaprenyl-diphosphatase [Algoriphagus sp.]|jgi:undecaprenyl-diphosphatase
MRLMERFFDEIVALDQKFFLLLNGLHTPFCDAVMPWITGRSSWLPLYLLLIVFIAYKFPKRQAIISILLILVAVGAADYITSGIMKPHFQRLRPCHETGLSGMVHLIVSCGGKFGFASSHAANSFALFGSLYFILKKYPIIVCIMFLWASLVSYSRIYVGVHYFGDVLVGGLVGFFISLIFYKILSIKVKK